MSDTPLSWDCVDCGRDTAPGFPGKSVAEALPESALDAIVLTATNGCEIYTVREVIWKRAGAPDGCLCVGCLTPRPPSQAKGLHSRRSVSTLAGNASFTEAAEVLEADRRMMCAAAC